MKINKRRKKIVLLTSYILAGFVVLGGAAYQNHLQAEAYRLQLENGYQHAFDELVSGVGELDSALQKTLYATTPSMVSSVCAEVYGKAQAAQYALGELPFSSYKYQNMSSFISKVGDYAYMLSKKASSGSESTEEDHQNLQKLSDTASVLSTNLNQLMWDTNTSGMSVAKIENLSDSASKVGDDATSGVLQDSFSVMEGEFPETPSLIYDGPFSSHIAGMTPKLLEDKSDITSDEALKKAAAFIGMKSSAIKSNGERGGNLPVYMFYANVGGGTVSFEVTKKGGYISAVFNSRLVKSSVISADDAAKIASRFLSKKGYKNMKQSYQMKTGNTLTINFAYTQNDVICYTDLIKVSVALDNGNIVGFESQGYIMNHADRDIPAAKVSEKDAVKKVSSYLKVLSHNMAIIPTAGKNEVFCHEFKCENGNGSHYIVYVNAQTGNEEKILILQETDQGTLAM
ncbi:germination protein YpeB [Sporobacter termitidis DSM 10068]|uniref:Germination protein YpeB n=1 Tax=Sporobacter termitidis DSM 10068 TaxID=1123282 RepID=A0A1M5WUI0_9FIRM|nr:germination protein YpeB [Sporobacter termitidis]SHH91249.1 germination protein YpeB [Sporobacter termitidis DSM 10068]